ncbi:MAG TPA: 2-C-methyl-D-erythritol 2,4-cyclodiphosphate synthase [Actinomycetota bacterium]|nr:2-C-methyl-D-erythritol 2,4-cyclodiphosphate synthase [Actinomycetota bacterium]
MGELLVGLGFDVHRFGGRGSLFLGGVEFPDLPGLAGHSDGDAVCHAVADALLGAAVLGDVGQHFPDTDPEVAGISGIELLTRTVALLAERSFAPWSADVTIVADRPAVAPRRDEMRGVLAGALGIPPGRVSVKATRPEGLGLSGDGIGCLALAVLAET